MKRPFQHKHKVHISVKNQQNINLVHIHTIAQCDSFAKILQEEQHQIKTKVKIHENWLNSPVNMQCNFHHCEYHPYSMWLCRWIVFICSVPLFTTHIKM